MTMVEVKQLPCPACGAEVETRIWSTLNVTINPERKEDLFKGELNVFQCSNCWFETLVAAPFLYHDMRNRILVQYYPAEALENDSFFDKFTSNGKLDLATEGMPEGFDVSGLQQFTSDLHLVFSMEELVRYVVFRDRLSELRRKADGD